VTADDLDSIESRLGVPLPSGYRQLLMNYPAELFERAAEYQLFQDPRFVINETMRQRLQGFGESRPRNDLLVIGDDGCGNYCCLDLTQEPVTVLAYDHEHDSYTEIAWSLDGWHRTIKHRAST
jgi:hypothetical protein